MSRVDEAQPLAEDSELFLAAIKRNDSAAVQQALTTMNSVYWSLSPFTHATNLRRKQIVRILLDAGANAQLTDSEDRTRALQNACSNGQLGIVQMLIDHESTLLDSAPDGWTPLMHACDKEKTKICRFLVDRGCNIHTKITFAYGEHGRNALMLAVQRQSLDIVRMLRCQRGRLRCGRKNCTSLCCGVFQ